MQIRSEGEILDVKPMQDVAITYTNPLFESDRVPVAVTTPLEFDVTPQTRRIFQFTPGMLMKPQRRGIPAELILGGIPICYGTLEYDGYSDTSLTYTFKGAEFENAVSGNLNAIPLLSIEKISYKTLVSNARRGRYTEFGLPMIIRKSEVAKIEYKTDPNINAHNEVGVMTKYANWLYTETPYFVPAIRIHAILNKVLPNLWITSYDVAMVFRNLAILGLYKNASMTNNCGVQLTEDGGNPEAEYCTVKLDLSDSLPEMSVADFIGNLLKMTCSTLYCSGRNYVWRANKDILSSTHAVDWTNKVADNYSCSAEKPQRYSLSFRNESDDYTKAKSDPMYQTSAPIIYECATMTAVIDKIKESDDYINLKHTPTGDIYSGKRIFAVLHYDRGVHWEDMWANLRTIIPSLDIVHQEGFAQKDETEGPKAEAYDCAIDFEVPRCMPIEVYNTRPVGSAAIGLRAVVPIVEFPSVGGDRPDTVYIGQLVDNNFVDKGSYFSGQIPNGDPGAERDSGISLAIDGGDGLYTKLHKEYAKWLLKEKDPRNVDLNLTPYDLQNLELWTKHMIHNQYWFIKSLEVTTNTSTELITTTAELAEA